MPSFLVLQPGMAPGREASDSPQKSGVGGAVGSSGGCVQPVKCVSGPTAAPKSFSSAQCLLLFMRSGGWAAVVGGNCVGYQGESGKLPLGPVFRDIPR